MHTHTLIYPPVHVPPVPRKSAPPDYTTIRITREVWRAIHLLRRDPRETLDQVLRRVLGVPR